MVRYSLSLVVLKKQHLINTISTAPQTFVSFLRVKSNESVCVVGGGEKDQRMLTLMGV